MGSLAVLPQRVSVITFKAALTALGWLSLSFMCLLDVGTFQTWTPSCCTWFLILGTLEHYCAFVNVVFVQRISLCQFGSSFCSENFCSSIVTTSLEAVDWHQLKASMVTRNMSPGPLCCQGGTSGRPTGPCTCPGSSWCIPGLIKFTVSFRKIIFTIYFSYLRDMLESKNFRQL